MKFIYSKVLNESIDLQFHLILIGEAKSYMKKQTIFIIIFLMFFLINNYFVIVTKADGGTINSAETSTGLISVQTDTDTFTFSGYAGQSIIIRMVRESDSVTPEIDLYSPNGSKETEAAADYYYNHVCVIEHVLENTGQYNIIVMDSGTDGIGNYSLSLMLIPGASTSSKDSDGGQISSGDNVKGKIDLMADTDAFTFNGNKGQSIIIRMVRESDSVTPEIDLYSPNGSKEIEAAADYYYNHVCDLEHVLENTGQYNIIVMDSGADGIGNYSLSLTIIGSESPEQPTEPTPDDVDGDGIPNTNDKDNDNDGFTDFIENIMQTDPLDSNSKPVDSDNDGIPDSIDDDNDNDGYTNVQETSLGTNPNDENSFPTNIEKQDSDNDGSSDNVDDDDDNDGYTDLQELYEGTNPLDATSFPVNIAKYDSDGDGISDSEDTDDDNDGMTDIWELFYGLNYLINDAQVDVDSDQYVNIQEFSAGTNPRDKTDYPGKSPSIFEHPAIRTISLVSTLLSIGGLTYAYINRTVWRFKRGIKKSKTLEELENFKEDKIQLAIDSKKLKSKQAKNIMKYYEEKKTQLEKK